MSWRWYIVLYPSFPISRLVATGGLCVYALNVKQTSALVSEGWQRELEILSFACRWHETLTKSKHAFPWLSFSNLLREISNFNISHVFRDVRHVKSEDLLSSGRFSSTMGTWSPINILRLVRAGMFIYQVSCSRWTWNSSSLARIIFSDVPAVCGMLIGQQPPFSNQWITLHNVISSLSVLTTYYLTV